MGQLVTYHTAVLAREKGFNEYCENSFDVYDDNKLKNIKDETAIPFFEDFERDLHGYKNYRGKDAKENYLYRRDISDDMFILAPTKEELKTWLRKEHNIDVTVLVHGEIDLYVKDSPLLKTYSARVDNWNVHWSVHDGTGLVMPEHYYLEGSNYDDAFEQGLYKALELI